MRERFHGQLKDLGEQLARLSATAATELRLANCALFDCDLGVAAEVVAADRLLDAARDECELAAHRLLALQAPVAGDLRLVLAAVYCADRLERMGDLARHIAETAARAHPDRAVPEELLPAFEQLAACTAGMAEDLQGFLTRAGGPAFERMRAAETEADALHQHVLTRVTDPRWPYGVPVAVNVTLLARFYGRFADQAVSVARRADFATTGALPG
ncbi:phosphate signaling complex PhoU family protein [Amycolatopsis magusensis]|uniref:Phosphate transport system protein n=1 Tax=Amycolatopsis magusensis TaxID=882444 RepID=A0ABS4Q1V6_9PSEU|nr:PhoU domain-containing protein [Amycolatopsis magusensis]MBP2185064.1 phosphate transport system protein [Amycolatopsis magusensis]